jgi:hypothetical protein
MDSGIIAALITSSAAVFIAILNLIVKPTPAPPSDKPQGHEPQKSDYRISVVILVFGFLLSVIFFLGSISKYKEIIPDFGYVFCDSLQSNSSMYIEHQKGTILPRLLEWLSPNVVEIITSHPFPKDPNLLQSLNADMSRPTPIPKECLYIESHLRPTNSWSGFILSKHFDFFSVDLSQKSEMLLVLNADSNDIVEIGLKDVENNEAKLKMPVKSGWHGYAIPIANFRYINNRSTFLFLFAHSSTVSLVPDNKFWIAYIGFR